MKKYLFIIIILIFLDIFLFNLLNEIISNRFIFNYVYLNKPIIYKKQNIKLTDINEFIFEDYFEILDFNNYKCKYSFDEDNKLLIVNLNDSNYVFNYELIEPIVITQTEYITETIYIENNDNNNEFSDYYDNKIYFTVDYYEFELGTDISTIISAVQDDIESYTNVTCDYSKLNPYAQGEYEILFYNDYEKVIKTVKII